MHQYDSARTDPGLGRRAVAPASLRQPDRLPELLVDEARLAARRRRSTSASVGPDATNYPVTLVVVPGPRPALQAAVAAGPALATPRAKTMLRRPLDGARGDGIAAGLARCRERPVAASGRDAVARRPPSRGSAGRAPTAAYVAPVGQMEETVAEIWRELFEVDGSAWTTTSSISAATRCSSFELTSDFAERSAPICRSRRSSSTRRCVRSRGT